MNPWLQRFANVGFRRSSDTAHDLKTPLNVAVLNLELLRMRARKVAQKEDEKIDGYARAIELELRRLARIFDAFFVYAAPPREMAEPGMVDVHAVVCAEARAKGHTIIALDGGNVLCHEERMRELSRLLFGAAARLFRDGSVVAAATVADGQYSLALEGLAAEGDFDLGKVFKFYYTDPSGNPDLSLATARLIAETYGGDMQAESSNGRLRLTLSLPLGEQ